MTTAIENLHLAMPEMIILAAACIALLGDLFVRRQVKSISLITAVAGLIAALVCSWYLLGDYKQVLFNGHYISDDPGILMHMFILITVALSFLYSQFYIADNEMPAGDYYVLGLLSTLGMMILVSAYSLLTVYLGLELLSLPVYAMTASQRSNANASEAAIKYFIMGAIASAMLLYGMSLLYGATGSLHLSTISKEIAEAWPTHGGLLSFALVFIIAGVGFKLALVPFHMWAPDVYSGAPASVALFISTATKVAAIGMALRLLSLGLIDIAAQWQQIILVMALLSTGLGNLFAIVQTNIKRLLAYSAVSHVGYAMFGLLAANAAGYAAALYYILVYSLMSAAAFGLVVLLSNKSVEIENIDDLKGLNKRNPWLAFMMLIVMFSMAGVPPTVGFFTKLLVLKALVDVNMTWVAIMGLLFAVIGAYYYIRIVKTMYFEKPEIEASFKLQGATQWLLSLNCLSLLFLGIFPGALIAACMNAFS